MELALILLLHRRLTSGIFIAEAKRFELERLWEQEEDIIIWIKIVSSVPSFEQYRDYYFSYEPRFSGVFSRDNLLRIKDGAYVIKLDGQQSKGTNWISLFIDRNKALYFYSFGIVYIPQEVINKIKDKSITHNIFRIYSDDSIICGFYCITFIEYIIAENFLLHYTN